LVLSGYAPDRATRDAITARAERVFAGDVDASAIEIASGVPEGADWLSAVDFAVAQLARLRRGVLKIEDAEILIEGEAASAEVRAEVARQLRQAPAPFEGRTRISAPAPAPGEEALEVSSDAAGSASTDLSVAAPASLSLAECQARIDAIMM